MPDRAPGFYWVRPAEDGRFVGVGGAGKIAGRWTIAELRSDDNWRVIDWEIGASESDFAEIGPRVDSPDEARKLG